jgi:hypothetical protein
LHYSRKIIEIIVKDAKLGPFHDTQNAPLMRKLGFQTKIQHTKPRNTKKTVWVKLGLSLYIGIERERLQTILALGFMPVPENWEQICSDHWASQ